MPKQAALILGSNPVGNPDLRELEGVDNDVSAAHGFFQYVAKYPIVQELRNRGKDEILRVLRDVLSKLDRGDLLVIYFSGHGHTVHGQHVLLCPNARLQRLEYFREAIPIHELRRDLEDAGVQGLLILDCCRSDLYRANTRDSRPAGLQGEQLLRDIVAGASTSIRGEGGSSFSIFCGCSEDQVALEIPGIRRGLFTMAALEEFAERANRHVEVRLNDEVRDAVEARMWKLADEYSLPVKPKPWKQSNGAAPILVDGRPAPPIPAAPAAVELTVTTDPPGAELEVDGLKVGTSPVTLSLNVGRHYVKGRLSGHRSAGGWAELKQARVQLALTLSPIKEQAPQAAPAAPAPVPPEPPAPSPAAPPVHSSRFGLTTAIVCAVAVVCIVIVWLALRPTDRSTANAPSAVSEQPTASPPSGDNSSAPQAQPIAVPPAASVSASPAHDFTNWLGMKFVRIEPGRFQMGSPSTEAGHQDDETQHWVTLTKAFYMGVYLVTRGQFASFVRETGYDVGSGWKNPGFEQDDDHPVVNVSWNDAHSFIAWLNRKDAPRHYRLPTEAEWEFACRNSADDTNPFNTGQTISTDQANYDGRTSYGSGKTGVYRGGTTKVGTFLPNARGLYDMHGNALQWCQDAYGPYGGGDETDPIGPQDANASRVLRGGSWYYFPQYCRSALRNGGAPDDRNNYVGFRVVLDSP